MGTAGTDRRSRARAAAPSRRSRAWVTVITAAAAGLAAGCGGSGPASQAARPLSPRQAIALAAGHARAVNSFGSTLSVRMAGPLSGIMAGTMQIRRRPSLLAGADFRTLDFGGRNLPGGMQEIVTSRSVYLKIAAFAQQLHKPWVKISFTQLQRGTGVNLGQLTQQVQGNNPLVQAQMLAGASNVRTVGTQTVGGVTTTHYAGSYPVSAGLAKLPPSLRALEQKSLRALGVTTVNFNVWIDAQHQTRKIISTETGGAERVTVTMRVTGIGQPVSVSLPPDSQVAAIPASALRG